MIAETEDITISKSFKKIVLLHAHNTMNNGSFMMLINFIHYFSLNAKHKIEFLVELQSDEDFKRLKTESVSDINISRLNLRITAPYNGSILGKLLNLREKLFIHPKLFKKLNASAVVILGGDDISEYYKGWQIISDLFRIKQYSSQIPVFLVAQTIGPFYSWRKKLAAKWLKDVTVFFRDDISKKQSLKYLKVNKYYLASDLAFLDLPFDIKEISKNEEKQYIVLVPSGFFKLYTSDKKSYINGWKLIIKNLISMEALKNCNLILMPHVTAPEDDRLIISECYDLLTDSEKQRVTCISDSLLPSQARNKIGNALFTITARMHPAVSSLQTGKPAIALSYSVKYKGVIGNCLGRDDLIIESQGENIWKNAEIAGLVSEKVNYLLRNFERIISEIVPAVEKNKISAIKQIKEICKILNV